MTVLVRVNYLPQFDYGADAVLLSLDGGGVAVVVNTLREAIRQGTARMDCGNVTHEFVISDTRADIHLEPRHVTWHLDRVKADEIADGLTVLDNAGSGHVYVDIWHPAPTLVISRDEYGQEPFPWIDPPAAAERPGR